MGYIKKEPIIAFITKGLNNPDKAKAYGYDAIEILTEIEYAPAADVVEVTRCKNCKYCFDAIMGGMWCEHPDNIMPLGSNPDDFCSYGEPKEETK